jgi:uncharacterized RDD family membrane protein YckC
MNHEGIPFPCWERRHPAAGCLGRVNRQPAERLGAWLIDLLCIAGWVAVLAVVGAALYLTGVLHTLSADAGNAASFVVLIVPVTVALARFEAGSREATVGKRARRLRVVDAGTQSRVSFARALLRNTVKVAVPWELGHTVAYGLIGTTAGVPVPGWLIVTTVAAYVLPAVYVVTLFVVTAERPTTGYPTPSSFDVTKPPSGRSVRKWVVSGQAKHAGGAQRSRDGW